MKLAVLAATLLAPALVHAASGGVPDICSTVFSQGIRNNYDVFTEEERFNLYKQRILSIKSDSYNNFRSGTQAVGINLPIADALLGLSGSNEEKEATFREHFEEFKASTYSEDRYRRVFQSKTAEISTDLLKSWNSCVELYYATWVSQKGIVVSVSPLSNFMQFVVTVDVKPAILGKVKILAIEPTGVVSCVHGNSQAVEAGTTKIGTAAFSMTCTKDPTLAIPFAINTDAGISDTINVPAASSKIAELTFLVGQLRQELDELREANVKQHANLEASLVHTKAELVAALVRTKDEVLAAAERTYVKKP